MPHTKKSHSRSTRKARKAPSHNRQQHHHSHSIRWICALSSCGSTFTRVYDLIRHEKTIHGPKQTCSYPHCIYATARTDKMVEHEQKIHPRAQGSSSEAVNITSEASNLRSLFEQDIYGGQSEAIEKFPVPFVDEKNTPFSFTTKRH
ncbi:uncharacterized protein BDZ99DRAFT_501283 [Mytilinidion resinicola]|uniref:C2H2-type domain-containing protein n=1 Tax=Mytilinidion resinicola TaxID=574789 RepID=A0A6A6YEM5_9PEZI|nr:uncharacterized protein BDZ99DRAFT_501283 [Mytilinidion resinicola]KAF2806454.1 hypothetical protein BDZ99DRAFT_501283 [Mytilinidion resinicola]